MGKIFKMILLPLILVSILSLPITTGCNGGGGDFAEGELEQILADSVNIVNTADSYNIFMDFDVSMDMEGGGEEGSMDMGIIMDGAYDQKDMDMYLTMDMSMSMDLGYDKGSEEMTMEMYLVDDYLYMYMEGEWMKMPATEEALAMYDINLFEEQMAPLESSGELKFLKYETIDGAECYVIELIPDIAAIMDLLGEQGLGELGLSLDDIGVVRDMLDKLSYICWIEKDTGYMKKVKTQLRMKITGDAFRDIAGVSGELIMDMTAMIEISGYNEPVNINLPAEAENAMEMNDFMY